MKPPLSDAEYRTKMDTVNTPLTAEELLAESRKGKGKSSAPPPDAAKPVGGTQDVGGAEAAPVINFKHVMEKGRAEAASQGGYFAGYSFAG